MDKAILNQFQVINKNSIDWMYEDIGGNIKDYGNIGRLIYQTNSKQLKANLLKAFKVKTLSPSPDGKSEFEIYLRDKKTGIIVSIYDYKGEPSCGASFRGYKNEEFVKDLALLIQAIHEFGN